MQKLYRKDNPADGYYCMLVDADSTDVNLKPNIQYEGYKDEVNIKVRNHAFTKVLQQLFS